MEHAIGHVTHYYRKIGVAVVLLKGELKLGDTIQILGHSTDLIQKVRSLESEHHKIMEAGPRGEVALKVDEPVRAGDRIFLVPEAVQLEEETERFR